MVGGDDRAEAERAAGKDHILDGWINAGATNAVQVSTFAVIMLLPRRIERISRRQVTLVQAGHQQYWRVTHMVPQMCTTGHHSLPLRLGQMGRGPACLVYGLRYIRGLAVQRTDSASLIGVTNDDEMPVLRVAGRWRSDRGVEHTCDQFLRNRIGTK